VIHEAGRAFLNPEKRSRDAKESFLGYMETFHLCFLWNSRLRFIPAIRTEGPLEFQEDMSLSRINTRDPTTDVVPIGTLRKLGPQEIIVNAFVTNGTFNHLDSSFNF